MSDFIREVEEALAHDRMADMFRRHRLALLGAVLAVLAGVLLFQAYKAHEKAIAEEASNAFEAVLADMEADKRTDANGVDVMDKLNAFIATAPSGYKTLARFLAAAQLGKNDPAKGITAYDGLANDASLDDDLRALAKLRAAILAMGADAPAQDAKAIIDRLDPLTVAGAPFAATARELRAAFALGQGDYDTAVNMVDLVLGDYLAPEGLRRRAELMSAVIRADRPRAPAPQPTPALPPQTP